MLMSKKTLFYDTNAILHLGKAVFEEFFYISWITLEEIEKLKTLSPDNAEIKRKAGNISRLLRENCDKYEVLQISDVDEGILKKLPKGRNDSIIIATAYKMRYDIVLVTDDNSMWNLASNLEFPIECVTTNNLHLLTNIHEYRGYKTLHFTDAQMARFYSNLDDNHYACKENEYLAIYNRKNELQDIRVWRDGEFRETETYPVKGSWMDKVSARNTEQKMAFDMLKNPKIGIKVVTGKYGTGKDFIMLAHALSAVQHGRFQKIVWVRNNVVVKDSKEIGFLPGDSNEKLLPYAMPIADQLGGIEPLLQMIDDGIIEIQPLAFIRGRSFNNAIIYCSEAENLTAKQVQLIIGRVGENSQVWLNGDYRQADSAVFANDSGLIKSIERLAGQKNFAYVKLEKGERSAIAELADLLDD